MKYPVLLMALLSATSAAHSRNQQDQPPAILQAEAEGAAREFAKAAAKLEELTERGQYSRKRMRFFGLFPATDPSDEVVAMLNRASVARTACLRAAILPRGRWEHGTDEAGNADYLRSPENVVVPLRDLLVADAAVRSRRGDVVGATENLNALLRLAKLGCDLQSGTETAPELVVAIVGVLDDMVALGVLATPERREQIRPFLERCAVNDPLEAKNSARRDLKWHLERLESAARLLDDGHETPERLVARFHDAEVPLTRGGEVREQAKLYKRRMEELLRDHDGEAAEVPPAVAREELLRGALVEELARAQRLLSASRMLEKRCRDHLTSLEGSEGWSRDAAFALLEGLRKYRRTWPVGTATAARSIRLAPHVLCVDLAEDVVAELAAATERSVPDWERYRVGLRGTPDEVRFKVPGWIATLRTAACALLQERAGQPHGEPATPERNIELASVLIAVLASHGSIAAGVAVVECLEELEDLAASSAVAAVALERALEALPRGDPTGLLGSLERQTPGGDPGEVLCQWMLSCAEGASGEPSRYQELARTLTRDGAWELLGDWENPAWVCRKLLRVRGGGDVSTEDTVAVRQVAEELVAAAQRFGARAQ